MSENSPTFLEQYLRDYGDSYWQIPRMDPSASQMAETARSDLIDSIGSGADWTCRGTKVHTGGLSPGCRRCTEGKWSCLFINGRCNANCFFCPSEQTETGEPTTQTLNFASPRDYVGYLDRFGFTGASLSGGEPFLTFERSLTFVEQIRRKFRGSVHLWLYSNGLLHTEQRLQKLADAGLDEIRINLAAGGYDLAKVQKSLGVIPTVTVEIPAIPEDEGRLRALLPELAAMGVAHLNLHQLRLTPFNFNQMIGRGYRFLHGPRVTVIESELTALRLIEYSLRNGIDLPINYCSFIYKHRYQAFAARSRWGRLVAFPFETETDAGFLRTIAIPISDSGKGEPAAWLAESGVDQSLWRARPSAGLIDIHPGLLEPLGERVDRCLVRYAAAGARMAPSYQAAFREFEFGAGRSLFVERRPVSEEFNLGGTEGRQFIRWVLSGEPECTLPEPIAAFETLGNGLLPYA